MDRHCFEADPESDPNFDVDDDTDPGRHQNNADPPAEPNPSFTHVGKSEFFYFK